MRCTGLAGMTVKITACWDVTPCSLVDSNISEEHAVSIFRVQERVLRNIGTYLPRYNPSGLITQV
jgi:hypothetical protein